MRFQIEVFVVSVIAVFIAGCAGSGFNKADFDDSRKNVYTSSRLTEFDVEMLSRELVSLLLKCPEAKTPGRSVVAVIDRSGKSLDTELFSNRIQKELQKNALSINVNGAIEFDAGVYTLTAELDVAGRVSCRSSVKRTIN